MFGNVSIFKDDLTINSAHELIALDVSQSGSCLMLLKPLHLRAALLF